MERAGRVVVRVGGSGVAWISVARRRRCARCATYGREMADQPVPPTPPEPGAIDPVAPGTGVASEAEPAPDDTQTWAAYLPIGLVFLVLGFSGLVNDSLRYAALAFLPVGFVFLILAMRGRTADDPDHGAAHGEAAPATGDQGAGHPGTGDPDAGDPDPSPRA